MTRLNRIFSCSTPHLLIQLFLLLFYSSVFCQQARSIDDYDIIQFITQDGISPHEVLNLDNNGAIALACINECTETELKARGIAFTTSQLRLMNMTRVLEKKGDYWKTAIPLFDNELTLQLRQITKSVSTTVVDQLTSDIGELTDLLKKQDRDKSSFSILFSYIIDGLVWKVWDDNGTIKPRQISEEEPFWSGEVWGVYPPRPLACGTNSISEDGIEFNINWSHAVLPKMSPFIADWTNLGRMFDDYKEKGRIEHTEAKNVFSKYQLFDDSGYFTIPIIIEKQGDPLYELSLRIADHLAHETLKLLDINKIKQQFGLRDASQTLIIVYHELMWDLMDEQLARKIIKHPTAFAHPKDASATDIGDLIFIVRSTPQ